MWRDKHSTTIIILPRWFMRTPDRRNPNSVEFEHREHLHGCIPHISEWELLRREDVLSNRNHVLRPSHADAIEVITAWQHHFKPQSEMCSVNSPKRERGSMFGWSGRGRHLGIPTAGVMAASFLWGKSRGRRCRFDASLAQPQAIIYGNFKRPPFNSAWTRFRRSSGPQSRCISRVSMSKA
jgi:hypothetical protein